MRVPHDRFLYEIAWRLSYFILEYVSFAIFRKKMQTINARYKDISWGFQIWI